MQTDQCLDTGRSHIKTISQAFTRFKSGDTAVAGASGTAITVFLAIRLMVANSFNPFGILHPDILKNQ
ncbi:MAG: hypothetical protein R6V15_11450 [Desulfotignum sp.]